jgi:hypothetical protein
MSKPAEQVGHLYLAVRRLEKKKAAIKARDPFSGELAARGELQKALDAADLAAKAAADAIIQEEAR